MIVIPSTGHMGRWELAKGAAQVNRAWGVGQSPSSAPPPSGQPHRGRNWTGTHEHPTAAPSAEAPRHPPGPGDQLYCTQPPNLTRGRAADRKPRRTPPTARASEPLRSRPVAPPTRPDARHPAGRCRPQTTAQGENHRASAHWLTEGTVGVQRPARRGANRMVLGVDTADLLSALKPRFPQHLRSCPGLTSLAPWSTWFVFSLQSHQKAL